MVEDAMSRAMRGFNKNQMRNENKAFKSMWAKPKQNITHRVRPQIFKPIIKSRTHIINPISIKTSHTCILCGAELRSRRKYCSRCRPWGTRLWKPRGTSFSNGYDSEYGILFLLVVVVILLAGIFYALYLFITWVISNIVFISAQLLLGGVGTFLISKYLLKNDFPNFTSEKDLIQNLKTLIVYFICSAIFGIILLFILLIILSILLSSIIADILLVLIISIIIIIKFNLISKIKNYINLSKNLQDIVSHKKIEIRDGGFIEDDTHIRINIKKQDYKELFKSNIPKWVNTKKKNWLFNELIPRRYEWDIDTLLLNGHHRKYKIIAINKKGHVLLRVYAKEKHH